jgi:hypothetical protein
MRVSSLLLEAYAQAAEQPTSAKADCGQHMVKRRGVMDAAKMPGVSDDHLTTILPEKPGKSRKILETKSLEIARRYEDFRRLRAFLAERGFVPESLRMYGVGAESPDAAKWKAPIGKFETTSST